MVATKKSDDVIEIVPLIYDRVKVSILGTSPLLAHRFSAKARQELLLPGRKINRAGLQAKLKHDPVTEFRQAMYRNRDKTAPALVHLPGGMFRQAIAEAAKDMPGDATKAATLRWISIEDMHINLYGIPKLHMSMVRSSGVTRTPDVRTRPCFPEWACSLSVGFPRGKLTMKGVLTLISGAGLLCGVGDWRPQKGGDFGKFTVAEEGEQMSKFTSIVKGQGRKAQLEAWGAPEVLDEDTGELLEWFKSESADRELSGLPDSYAEDESDLAQLEN